jgi:mannitol/fructose-specific phosphotransferase system IIA component (Ntr-type)
MADRSGRLSDLLTPDRVVLPLRAADKAGAMAELTRALVSGSTADYDQVLGAVLERERAMSTGVGLGVAIPHGRAATVSTLQMAAGVSDAPMEWQAMDGGPVRLLFLVVGPEAGAGEHVKALARIARIIRHDTLRERLIDCRTPDEFHRTLKSVEAE